MGIICLTPDNLNAPWILFEAGALSKKLDGSESRVYTYLHKVASADIRFPLSMFQHTPANKEETRILLHSIRRFTKTTSPTVQGLDELFELMWPKLELTLKGVVPQPKTSKRKTHDMVQEILELTRQMARSQQEQIVNATSRYSQLAYITQLGNRSSNPAIAELLPNATNLADLLRGLHSGNDNIPPADPFGIGSPTVHSLNTEGQKED